MGNTDPKRKSKKNKYEVKPQYEELSKQLNMQHAINQCYECMRAIKESDSETRSVNPSQLGVRHSNPVVTTLMIALDFSGTTTQSASHNVALNQVVNQSVNQGQDECMYANQYKMHNAYN
ncbi:mediator-associated protein 1-like [Dorcoceras hygrometricum]|uniref:Mediator-associated protein 1-like n=1 Tax=Dorcoceras hygrometricum TaxID=472368 RepID=A0A2Z7A812_9LAMI|nr:mediator-associated protein 1-like [Dorcoceras hygrometricum]